MPFDFSKVKAQVRQTVMDTLGVPALYQDNSINDPQDIRARWHSKIDRMGDLDNGGYAETIEGIDRVILLASDARALNMKHGGIVTFPDFAGAGADLAFVLDTREPSNGPVEESWLVTRA